MDTRDRYADEAERDVRPHWNWSSAKAHTRAAFESGSFQRMWGVVERLCKVSYQQGRAGIKRDGPTPLEKAARDLLIACWKADAAEELGEDVDGKIMEAVADALLMCGVCDGTGSKSRRHHEDEVIKDPCDECGGWGILPKEAA